MGPLFVRASPVFGAPARHSVHLLPSLQVHQALPLAAGLGPASPLSNNQPLLPICFHQCRCTELYRYLLTFGPEQPEQYELRRRFVAGHCPCCLRICLRWVMGLLLRALDGMWRACFACWAWHAYW